MVAGADSAFLLAATAYATYAVALSLLSGVFTRTVTEPYMDEPFHVGQTQMYCAGQWLEWDPKITTFPGLYIFGVIGAGLRELAVGFSPTPCDLSTLRAVNVVPALATPWLLHSLLAALHPSTKATDLAANAAVLSLLPTHFFFHFLYYTDSFATCSVLLLLLLSMRAHSKKDSVAFLLGRAAAAALAISFRQTNAVWVAFAAAAGALREMHAHGELEQHASVGTALSELLLGRAPRLRAESGTPPAMLTLIGWLCRRDALPLLLLVAFVGFVFANGGVVVGDRSNHAMAFHLAQLLYLTGLASAPFHLPALTYQLPNTLRAALTSTRAAPRTAAVAVAAVLLAARCTLCHPFLLADNRHVTFYLWRHLLGRHWLVKYLLTPAHLLLAGLLYPPIYRAQGALLTLGLLACSLLVLVPSPLIEPRYLTLPALLLRLHAPPLQGARAWLPPLAAFAASNAATLALFLLKPYTWGDGSVARFMW